MPIDACAREVIQQQRKLILNSISVSLDVSGLDEINRKSVYTWCKVVEWLGGMISWHSRALGDDAFTFIILVFC